MTDLASVYHGADQSDRVSEDVEKEEVIEAAAKMMEETHLATDDDLDDSFDQPPAERWAPLGAANTTPPPQSPDFADERHMTTGQYLAQLESEQEELNSSLLALTTHFAQVQFRLKQIVSAEPDEKEKLLKELEEFAFKGIPDVRGCTGQDAMVLEEAGDKERESKLAEQREKQQQLITQLKTQLQDLEEYAYETGAGELPTTAVMDKQRVIVDELTKKLDVDFENFDKLSTDELRNAVDSAVGSIVNPAKVKEKLVDQLKTQITDLERFISFLQGEAQTPGPLGKSCSCPVHDDVVKTQKDQKQKTRAQTLSLMKQMMTILQIFAISSFGCGSREFQRNVLKRTTKGNHWGDLRAKLEVCIDSVLELAKKSEENAAEEAEYTSDSEDDRLSRNTPMVTSNQELTTAVRKDLAMALRDLMQHGLIEVGQSTSLVPMFGCFPNRNKRRESPQMMHAWDLFVKFYEMKHGKEYNESPARKLSQSFDLQIVGGKAVTAKQTLLGAIDAVLASHVALKRSQDSQFKAFICHALNQKRLVPWLRLVLRTNTLVEYYYQPWSYVIRTGFDDALRSLDRLSSANFTLPVDLAVRPFQNIKDAF